MKTIKLTLIAILTLVFTTGFSQSEDKSAKRKAKISKMLTKKLDLTEEEQKNFLPLYEQYISERKAQRQNFRKGDKKGRKVSELTDPEIDRIILNSFEFNQKELDLKKSYHPKFKQVLPIKKVAKLYRLEKKGMRKMKGKRKGKRK